MLCNLLEFYVFLFHPVSNLNTLRHQFESGKTQKTAGRRLSVAIGNTKVTIAIIHYSGLRNVLFKTTSKCKLTI
jgi:hypothetical protein